MANDRSFLVLWQTAEAETWIGTTPSGSVGSHMKGLEKGDRIFIAACDGLEIFLLGAMRVTGLGVSQGGLYSGKPRVDGKTLAGAFQMKPLGRLKWRLRFEGTDSPKLSPSRSLLWQVRSRRRLSPSSADLLLRTLKSEGRVQTRIQKQFSKEGRLVQGTKRERDPKLRRAALRAYNFTCVICGLRPFDSYGPFAKDCLDVHHLKPLASGGTKRPTLQDVILACPTCHRALHMFGAPAAWKRFRREVCS